MHLTLAPMHLGLVIALAVGLAGCARPVTLERYHGAYSTHFEGIPDRTALCALVTNRGDESVGWVRLRLRSTSSLGSRTARVRSHWVYSGGIDPGETVALAFVQPPIAEQIQVDLAGSGRGRAARPGRPLARAKSCSEAGLVLSLESELEERTASGIEVLAAQKR